MHYDKQGDCRAPDHLVTVHVRWLRDEHPDFNDCRDAWYVVRLAFSDGMPFRQTPTESVRQSADSVFRNIPTLAFVFYAALVIPNEFFLPGTKELVSFPTWLKAAIALSAGQIGLQVDQFVAAIAAWRRKAIDEAMLVLPNWFMGFLMTSAGVERVFVGGCRRACQPIQHGHQREQQSDDDPSLSVCIADLHWLLPANVMARNGFQETVGRQTQPAQHASLAGT